MMIHKVSLIQPLPQELRRAHPVVRGGHRRHARQLVRRVLPGAEQFLREHGGRPRELAPDVSRVRACRTDQKKAWLADRTGAIVGIDTAKKFGWKIGDRVPLISPIYRKPDGLPWEFTIDGIYDSPEKGTDKTQFFFHYDYMNETFRAPGRDRGSGRLVRHPGEGSRPAPTASRSGSTRCSRTRRPRPRRRPRRRSSRTSRSRSATSAAS